MSKKCLHGKFPRRELSNYASLRSVTHYVPDVPVMVSSCGKYEFREVKVDEIHRSPLVVEGCLNNPLIGAAFDWAVALQIAPVNLLENVRACWGRALEFELKGLDYEIDKDLQWIQLNNRVNALANMARNSPLDAELQAEFMKICCMIAYFVGLASMKGSGREHDRLTSNSECDLDAVVEQYISQSQVETLGVLIKLWAESFPAVEDPNSMKMQLPAGRRVCDLLVDGHLYELKTVKNPTLSREMIKVMIDYVLEVSKTESISWAGWYFGRHGRLWGFDIDELIQRLSGERISIRDICMEDLCCFWVEV